MVDPAWVWLLIAAVLLVTLAWLGGPLLLVDLAVAALVVTVVTALLPALALGHQLLLYLLTALLFLPACYAVAFRWVKHRHRRVVAPAEGYAGAQGVIVSRGAGVGVRVHDEVFPAQAIDGSELTPGKPVTVVEMRGITAFVCHRPWA
ncbi:MAG: hypothetical protein ACLFSI_07765 [Halorhodospira sp.]